MAFGLGFNKAKVLSAAEKYVSQGKIPAAIEEYQKILHRDPKDLMILNTVADLYVRAGKNQEALKCFHELAEKCVEAGSIPRAIAVYKRITKVAPDSVVQAILRLGELYSMQGLLRDAREHYLQAVEFYSQHHEKDKAREVFEKVLMLDMENPQLQVRMAELYAETGKNKEAIATYLGAVERFLNRNQPAEADTVLQRVLQLDPQNPEACLLLGRAQLERGEFDKAVQTLEAIPSLAGQKNVLNLLFQAYSKKGDDAKAKEIASQRFADGDVSGLAHLSDELISRGEMNEALEIYETVFRGSATQPPASFIADGLRKILATQPSHTGALELMSKLLDASGNAGEAREITEQLAHAYVMQGDLEKAREIYSELAAIEPENPQHVVMLRQVEEQMGIDAPASESSTESAAALITDFSVQPEEQPPQAPALPAREEQLLKECLTESDLYSTYHQSAKAIEALERGLAQLPGNITLNEHLLPLYEEVREYRKAVKCCEELTEAYVQLGDGERASRFGEMILANQQKAEQKESEPAEAPLLQAYVQPASNPVEDSSASILAPSPEEQPQVREVDLSMEWATVAGSEQPAAASTSEDSLVEEIEFYLQAGLVSEAIAALDRLRQLSPSHTSISQFQERLGLAAPQITEVPTEPVAEPAADPSIEAAPADMGTSAEFSVISADESPSFPVAGFEPEPSGEFETVAAAPEQEVDLSEFLQDRAPAAVSETAAVPEQELVLEEALPAVEMTSRASEFELSLEQPDAPAQATDPFAGLAAELEDSLTLPGTPAREQAAAASAPTRSQPPAVADAPKLAAAASESQPQANALQDLFAEFKAEMEEPAAAEDLETHYNMGVAFKEMALYDEAIGEFQKVHQLAAKSKDYSHVVQCCSLLAACFLGKGLPELAVKWYQTAIDSPGVDPESALALLYEMASAYETAGDRQAALRSFLEVYARNIDYRDVAERIRTIQQAQ